MAKTSTSSAEKVAKELNRLVRGEIRVREFMWLNDGEKQILGNMALSFLEGGQAGSARAAFEVLVDLEPEVAIHFVLLGHACALAGDAQTAFQRFSEAINLSAPNKDMREVAAEAFLGRGDLLLRLGRTIEARADLADAALRMEDCPRRRAIESFLAS